MPRIPLILIALLALPCGTQAVRAAAGGAGGDGETVTQALCRLIEDSAKARAIPVPFLTRLIFRESAFRVTAVSPVGAQGVAQFMPGTARERGLLDPFDPEQAIPHAAHLLADLRAQFGNLGLAAAAYNGGPGRVSKWLAGTGGLPGETRAYVVALTGRPAEDWRPGSAIEPAPDDEGEKAGAGAPSRDAAKETPAKQTPAKDARGRETSDKGADAAVAEPAQSCLQVTALLRVPSRGDRFALPLEGGVTAPWGIQLAGNFSKSLALASFSRTRTLYAGVIGDVRPMIIGTRLRFRGTRAFYRIRIPAETRAAGDILCERIRKAGGACIVLRT